MRVERGHKFTVWLPNTGADEGMAEVVPTTDGVRVFVADRGVELDELDAVALYYALSSWMLRRGAAENEAAYMGSFSDAARAEGRGA